MRESLGAAFIVNLIIIFIIIFIAIFATSTSYTKAYKVKNQIVNLIEENNVDYSQASGEIEQFLGDVGYRVNGGGTCPDGENEVRSNYRYCVTRIDETSSNENKTHYYKVTAFMYFEIPVVGNLIEIPVKGETKSFGIFNG